MPFEVVIIGAVAAGPKAGSRIKRLRPDAHVVMVDKDDFISYGGCGIPFYVSGDVPEVTDLLSTSFHMVRDADFFKNVKGIDVLGRHRGRGRGPQGQKGAGAARGRGAGARAFL